MFSNLSELTAYGGKRLAEIRDNPDYLNKDGLDDVKVATGSKVSGKVPFPEKYSETVDCHSENKK